MRNRKELNAIPLAILAFLSGLSLFKAVEIKDPLLVVITFIVLSLSLLAVHFQPRIKRKNVLN